MSKHRLLLLIFLVVYIFAPTLLNWMMSYNGVWYRPFIIWALIIIAIFSLQKYNKPL